jgi:hypothetical protein
MYTPGGNFKRGSVPKMRFNRALVILSLITLVPLNQACNKASGFAVLPESNAFSGAVTYSNKVDILWVMDTTASMAAHQPNVVAQIGSFIDVIVSKNLDFHLAVTTTNMGSSGERGQFVGKPSILTSTTPDLKATFQSTLSSLQNTSALERGIQASVTAISPPLVNGVNAGFLRSDAFLAIVYIGNENDQSPDTVASYEAQINAIKPAYQFSGAWMANFIGVLNLDPSCSTNGQVNYPGARYMQLVGATDGINQSLCTSDLSSALSQIRQFIVSVTTSYKLNNTPVVDTIQVTVNGQVVPSDATNGWTYDPLSNVVWLHGSYISTNTSQVNVTYTNANGKT